MVIVENQPTWIIESTEKLHDSWFQKACIVHSDCKPDSKKLMVCKLVLSNLCMS